FALACIETEKNWGFYPRDGYRMNTRVEKGRALRRTPTDQFIDFVEFSRGGAEGDRTPDLVNAIHALSHLSYGPSSGGNWRQAFAPAARLSRPRREIAQVGHEDGWARPWAVPSAPPACPPPRRHAFSRISVPVGSSSIGAKL